MYSAGVDRTQEVELFHAHQSHSYCESTYMFLPGSKVPYLLFVVVARAPRRDRPSRLRVCCDEEITPTCIIMHVGTIHFLMTIAENPEMENNHHLHLQLV